MHPILFSIGPITIYTYGVLVFVGVILSFVIVTRLGKKEGIDRPALTDIIFWSLIVGFIGARIFYIGVNFGDFLQDPVGVGLSRSGFVFYGGLLFGLACGYLLCRKHKIPALQLADLVAVVLPLAHAFGRLGCFSYGCCYGITTDTWWGVLFPPSSPAGLAGHKVLPVQLIAAGALFVLFFWLWYKKVHQIYRGQIVVHYFILYGVFRFCIEFLRGDPRGSFFGILSVSQGISLVFIVAGITIWKVAKKGV